MEKEPKVEFIEDLVPEKPQTPKEILDILQQASGIMKEVEITVSGMREELPDRKARVLVDRADENFLLVTTKNGMSIAIEPHRVKEARIIE